MIANPQQREESNTKEDSNECDSTFNSKDRLRYIDK